MSKDTMETRVQRHQNDGDKDAAAPAIASYVFRILVAAVNKAMTTAIAKNGPCCCLAQYHHIFPCH